MSLSIKNAYGAAGAGATGLGAATPPSQQKRRKTPLRGGLDL
jgi:hypothetical protein